MLTQGWFWTHPGGCAAVYCGASPARMDLDRIVHVADVPAGTFTLPAHLSPPAGSTRCYLVRRFDSCGRPEQTIAAVVAVRIDSEGQLAPPAPNGVFGLAVEQTDGGRLRLTWLYEPLDQQAVPQEFCLYWDSGSGAVDREHPLATIAGRGRGCYRYETGPLAEGRYTFLLLARSAESAENPSAAALICRMTARVPEAPTILQGAAV